MRLRPFFLGTVFALLLACAPGSAPARAPRHPAEAPSGVVCRALEVHADAASRITAVVFHQADESSRAPLAEFLRTNSGAMVKVEIDGSTQSPGQGTVFRLKSCFGRGLLLLPAQAAMKEGTVFHLRPAAP